MYKSRYFIHILSTYLNLKQSALLTICRAQFHLQYSTKFITDKENGKKCPVKCKIVKCCMFF